MNLDWRTWNDKLLSEVQQAKTRPVIQRTGEASMTKLDVDQQKNVRDAVIREIQSWLQYHAVKAALRSLYAVEDVWKMRWVVRFKESEQANARLVLLTMILA